jgi:hypothetical protein
MAKEKSECECGPECNCHKSSKGGAAFGGGSYFLIFIGAAVYYVQQAETFWVGVLGILKALVWPAMLAYRAFELLHM